MDYKCLESDLGWVLMVSDVLAIMLVNEKITCSEDLGYDSCLLSSL